MIEISLFTFLAILEGIVVLLIVIGVLVWRQRAARAKDRIAYIDGSDAHPTPALYLKSEVAKTRTHLETLATESADSAQSALSLRAALLEVEAELSSSLPEERTRGFWQGLADRLDGVLATTGFNAVSAAATAEQASQVGNDEDLNAADIVAQQSKTIDYLRNYIQELLDQHGHMPSPEPNISGKFDELERANKELSGCVEILEDENGFLREQIAALLKME